MNELVSRWHNPALATFHKKLRDSLENGVFRSKSSPFGQIDERWDFRGYDFADARIIRSCQFDNIDFSESSFTDSQRIRGCSFRNVVFEKTKFNDFSEHGCLFVNCMFHNSSLHFCILGFDGSKYNPCVYEKCQFRRTSYIRAEFVQCKFLNNNLNGTEFGSSSFEECVFSGKVKNVWFRGGYIVPEDEQTFGKAKPNAMTVSFEDAELLEMTYSIECDLSKVILPKKGKYYRFDKWKERLDHVASIVSTWPDSDDKKNILFDVIVSMGHAPTQSWMIINRDEYIKRMGKNAAKKYIDLLSEI